MAGNQMNYNCMKNNSMQNGSMQQRGARPPYRPVDEVKMPDFDVGCTREAVMKNIYELGFVLVETMLYLDTHPNDLEALGYYAKMRDKYKLATEKYTQLYGPLQFTDVNNENYWTWVATPMPWEVEG